MNAEQYRSLVTRLENIEAGRTLVREYTDYNTSTNRMNYTETWVLDLYRKSKAVKLSIVNYWHQWNSMVLHQWKIETQTINTN